jgi:hypothetical protein
VQEYILIFIIVLVLFRFLRRFIVVNSYQGFQKAAQDFMRQQQQKERKPEGSVTIQDLNKNNGSSRQQQGEYVDYEEIK